MFFRFSVKVWFHGSLQYLMGTNLSRMCSNARCKYYSYICVSNLLDYIYNHHHFHKRTENIHFRSLLAISQSIFWNLEPCEWWRIYHHDFIKRTLCSYAIWRLLNLKVVIWYESLSNFVVITCYLLVMIRKFIPLRDHHMLLPRFLSYNVSSVDLR